MNVKEYLATEIPTTDVEVEDIVVHVKSYIPFDQAEAMAIEWAERSMVFDEENGFAAVGHMATIVEEYLILKYFTDFPLDDLSPEEVHDYLHRSGTYDKLVRPIITGNMSPVWTMYCSLSENMKGQFEKSHSIGTLLKKTFGFLFTGEDISETLAKSADITNRMVEVMEVFKEHSKDTKKNSPKMKVGGVTLNFAKK